jgi:uncharacterized membrane protein YczE
MLADSALRFTKLLLGLYLFGFGVALMVHASIGIPPWDVLAQGISKTFNISYGMASIVVSALVLTLWIPIRQKPGIGTVLNGILVGVFADSVFPWLPRMQSYPQQLGFFLFGMVSLALASGLYISSNLGAGPRDGFVVGMQRRLMKPLWLVRAVTEILALLIGFLLGGQVREGTVIFALGIGYLMQLSFRIFGIKTHKREDNVQTRNFEEPEPDPSAF